MTTERMILVLFGCVLVWLAILNARTLLLPDAITLTGIAAGLALSWFFPALHGKSGALQSLFAGVQGLLVGSIVVFGLSIGGKILFGKHHVLLPSSSKVILNQTSLVLPNQEIPYEEIFYRNSDRIEIAARTIHVRIIEGDKETTGIFENAVLALSPTRLSIGNAVFDPTQIGQLEIMTDRVTLPREVIGFGLLKLAGLIGAFLGWVGALFVVAVGGVVMLLGFLLAAITNRPYGHALDGATPVCMASIAWMCLRPRLLIAGGIAVLLGMITSVILHYLFQRNR